MPKATKKCRVCGKEYTCCDTTRHTDGLFHWREVACSPECGQKYLEMVLEARKPNTPTSEEVPAKKTRKKTTTNTDGDKSTVE